jgi:uncharacterized protein (TIGR02231 family)
MLGFYDPSVAWMRTQAKMPGVVSGRIVDESGNPVTGATVTVKGTNMAILTDENGFYKLQNIPVNSHIVVSSVGFATKEFKANPGYVTVTLNQNVANLQEVVVTGYALQGNAAGVQIRGASSSKKEDLQTVAISTQYQPTATVYKINEKYTLETDGKITTIGIKRFEISALYEYYTAPKLDPSAFLTARVVNWQKYDLQSGETNLYYEGTFLGKTYLDLSSVNDTLSLSLGKDNNIRVSRKLQKEFSAKKFLGSNKTESRVYEISVLNTKKVPVNIVVRDQFPVSINKDISVEDVSAPEGKVEKETGIVTWTLALQPGQEKKIKLSYAVRFPKERVVILEP